MDPPEIANFDTAYDDPSIVFEPPKPEPPKAKKLKKPELDRPLQKIPLEKLPDLFRVGSGPATYQLGGNYIEFIATDDLGGIFELRDLDRTPSAITSPNSPSLVRNIAVERNSRRPNPFRFDNDLFETRICIRRWVKF